METFSNLFLEEITTLTTRGTSITVITIILRIMTTLGMCMLDSRALFLRIV